MTFKIGDKVKITANTNGSYNKVGDIGTIIAESNRFSQTGKLWVVDVPGRTVNLHNNSNTREQDMVKVEDDLYEDGWILNDGKVTIPDDAQKSMHEGSVVAFRKRKVIPLVFGDELTSGSFTYKFIRYTDSKKDRVDIFNPETNSLLTEIFLNLLNRK